LRPRIDVLVLLGCGLGTASLAAQRDVDLLYGRWYHGNDAASYSLRTVASLGGHFSQGLAVHVLVNDALGRHRAFYGAGWELHALRRRGPFGPYFVAGAALGLSTDTAVQGLATLWDVGAGLEWRPVDWIGVGIEGRYRLEDRGPRGFWRTSARGSGRRDGVSLSAGLSMSLGGGRGGDGGPGIGGTSRPPPAEAPRLITGNAADIVRTALDAVGAPYKWGGTAENGFDCSGLMQWAYGQHGIRLPRMSRDQASAGTLVTPALDALQPGDILLFAAQPGGGVTHVGMYVGEHTFIHSSSTGVKLSRLAAQDPDGGWWVTRWVGVRRIVE
jgi:hypothetical protein